MQPSSWVPLSGGGGGLSAACLSAPSVKGTIRQSIYDRTCGIRRVQASQPALLVPQFPGEGRWATLSSHFFPHFI